MMGTVEATLANPDGKVRWTVDAVARLDTGASRSSIHYAFADLLSLPSIGEVTVRNANGKEKRELVSVVVETSEGLFELEVTLADRGELSYGVLLGRDYLEMVE
tara:strand:- start:235 stop:546 length:312 start_codon:yes stop_codon:yes gene_type:complete